MGSSNSFDIIVIGGGHAGTEAALAGARLGVRTLLLTSNPDRIGEMSCNPAIGGLGKSQLVREVDALGGEIGLAADYAGIQFRLLNRSKGPAVRALRVQADRERYKEYIKEVINQTKLLTVQKGMAAELIESHSRISEVISDTGRRFKCKAVILATGTFLNGKMFFGLRTIEGGRINDASAKSLSGSLTKLKIKLGRLKTGTPARILKNTIDFANLDPQYGDENPEPFSYLHDSIKVDQIPCYITYTNKHTHDIIRSGLDRSPLYTGMIRGIGPRYCPSIEDKIVRFKDKDKHQIFLEPEGIKSNLIYPNGISTSLPKDIQLKFIRTIPGLEHAEIKISGYGIEYDFVEPTQLDHTLKIKWLDNLFLAGQINGTSGYEEAAAQGLIAGINAYLKISGEPPFVVSRSNSYTGVMIDDLVIKGVDEPYRMFTSRAEYRLFLRYDNADFRLTEKGIALGLVTQARKSRFLEKKSIINKTMEKLKSHSITPSKTNNNLLKSIKSSTLKKKITFYELLKRSELGIKNLKLFNFQIKIPENFVNIIETEIKYEGYLKREKMYLDKFKKLEALGIPADFDYHQVSGIRKEALEKLEKIKPDNLGQALKIPGITPADITILSIFLKE